MTGGELFDRIVEKGSYSEKDAADLIKQVKSNRESCTQTTISIDTLYKYNDQTYLDVSTGAVSSSVYARGRGCSQGPQTRELALL